MEDEAEAIAFPRFKLREVQKVTNRQEEEIADLRREIAAIYRKLTENCEKSKEKLRLGREKERKRRDSLEKVQKDEREQTRLRTEKRQAGLILGQKIKEEEEASQFPE
jgi:hypothetical protein